MSKINIAVSACLLGQNVRYDGNNKFINLNKYFDEKKFKLVPICPEVEMGLSIPRPPIQLQIIEKQIRLVEVDNKTNDFTGKLGYWFSQRNLVSYSGFILKSKSPSCGYRTTSYYSQAGKIINHFENGMFVQLLLNTHPNLAIIDELNIEKKIERSHFLKQIQF